MLKARINKYVVCKNSSSSIVKNYAHSYVFLNYHFQVKIFYFYNSFMIFMITRKLSRRYWDFHICCLSPHLQHPPLSTSPTGGVYLLQSMYPHWYSIITPKSIVCIMAILGVVYSVFGEMYNGTYSSLWYHAENFLP